MMMFLELFFCNNTLLKDIKGSLNTDCSLFKTSPQTSAFRDHAVPGVNIRSRLDQRTSQPCSLWSVALTSDLKLMDACSSGTYEAKLWSPAPFRVHLKHVCAGSTPEVLTPRWTSHVDLLWGCFTYLQEEHLLCSFL